MVRSADNQHRSVSRQFLSQQVLYFTALRQGVGTESRHIQCMRGEVLFSRITNIPRFEAENSASRRGFDKCSNFIQIVLCKMA